MILSIIIPVYNEADYVTEVIDALLVLNLPSQITDFELIVVDDASHDHSFKIIEEIAKNKKELKLVGHVENRGKGAAVRTGLQHAGGDLFIVQDADLELSPEDIPLMINFLFEHDLDMVNGSRFLGNFMHRENSFLRNFANKLFSSFASLLIGKKITDITCGYKLFTRNVLENIELKENRFGIEAELLIKAIRLNKKKVKEMAVHYVPREVSAGKKIRAVDGFSILWTILKYSLFDYGKKAD